MARIRYAVRFAYWLARHRSINNAMWVMDYEGYKWN